MIPGFLEASTEEGRFELINNARTYAYAQALGVRGLQDCDCAGISRLACDPGPYTCSVGTDGCFTEAEVADLGGCNGMVIPVTADAPGGPWWDDSNPGSFDFVGFFALGATGLDSTYSREQLPNALSGQSFGARRREGRCITWDGWLIAKSSEGLEFGISYYDSLLSDLGYCNFFTLYFATACPGISELDDDLARYLRHVRRATLASSLEVLDTRTTATALYARVQFTLCSEQPWIYTEPVFAFEDQLFDKNNAICDVEFLDVQDQTGPLKATRNVLASRQRFPLQIARDGSLCRLGGWDWSETQYGGGSGVVYIADYVEAPKQNLELLEANTSETCEDYPIILTYDVESGTASFETVRWELPETGEIPCDGNVVVVGLRYRNDSFNDTEDVGPGNAEWTYTDYSSNAASEDCCQVSLNFTSKTQGSWSPVAVDKNHLAWSPVGRDSLTQELNFPPKNCSITVQTNCPETEESSTERLVGPDGYDRISVIGPVTYNANGSWVSANGITGCLPNSTCSPEVEGNYTVPYFLNDSDSVSCIQDNVCVIDLDTSEDRWSPSGSVYYDIVDQFPNPSCSYELSLDQSEDRILIQEEYVIDSGNCQPGLDLEFRKIFPSFESDCWEPTFIPEPNLLDSLLDCYCSPIEAVVECKKITNPSSTYQMAGSLVLKTGSQSLKNFRVRAWNSVFATHELPCDDPKFWAEREPDFEIRIPHLPSGCILRIDGEVRSGTLEFPGGAVEPAIRYVQGPAGQPFDFLYTDSCETVYIEASADKHNTADNAKLTMTFSNYYGASAPSLIRGV